MGVGFLAGTGTEPGTGWERGRKEEAYVEKNEQ